MSGPGRRCCVPAADPSSVPGPLEAAAVPERSRGPAYGGLRHPGELVWLPGGTFRMGDASEDGFPEDGEGPRREVGVSAFRIGVTAVTNREFGAFVRATRYATEAERNGSSYVFWLQLPEALRSDARRSVPGLPWWVEVDHACWQRPEGPGSHVHDRPEHPVVHVSWNDAVAYCAWSGTVLPTEAQWEYAARGGLDAARLPWGDELEPDGVARCNIWRGGFPDAPAPGWRPGARPVRTYAPNGFGLHETSGNVWEWCADWFSPAYHLETGPLDPVWTEPTGRRSMRGGSFLCHASYCNRYRVAARGSNTPSSASSNVGFRVVAIARA